MSTEMLTENLIENMRLELERNGWTQRDLAEESGLHWQTIHRILSGGMNPTLPVVEKIAAALGKSPEKILSSPG